VVHGFAPPAHDWLPGDRGVDLAARPGEAVVAAGAGRVSFAGTVGGTGVVVVAHSGGLATTYEPVRAAVQVGQVVALGERIGQVVVGWARCRPQICLHWGLKRAGSYLDPLGLVGAAQIRLLPVDAAQAPTWWPPTTVAAAALPVVFVSSRRRRRGQR
jgi:murein DD-endopeptidase MepM/ murein hydrolase activator NlpD